jgi:hypothetical protein
LLLKNESRPRKEEEKMPLVLHHVGHIGSNLEEVIEFQKNKYCSETFDVQVIEIPARGAWTAMVPSAGTMVELIETAGLSGDPAGRCRDIRGVGPFQLAFACNDYDAELAAAASRSTGLTPFG